MKKKMLTKMILAFVLIIGVLLPYSPTEAATSSSKIEDQVAVQLKKMKKSPALLNKNITVINNTTSTNDEVKVKGVKKGDTVRVYNSSKKLLKADKVKSGTLIIVYVKQLGTKAGKINVTIQKSGMPESSFTTVSFKQEAVNNSDFVTNILKNAKGNILHSNNPQYYMMGMQETGQIWLGIQTPSWGDDIFYNSKLSKVTKSSAIVSYELTNGKKGTGTILLKNNVLTLKYIDGNGETKTIQFSTTKKEQEKIIESIRKSF